MRQTFTKMYATLALVLISTFAFSQGIVKGIAWDGDMKEAMVGANVVVKGTMNGVTTDFDGNFELTVEPGKKKVVFSFMGYTNVEKTITVVDGQTIDLGKIVMNADAVGLQEIQLIADIAIDRKTPVAVSRITPMDIEEKLGTQEFPEILKTTPGVYATKQGGGYGDSRINLRGFTSENIAVMINGVPVNDMEWGGIYWSNWAGLSDVTRSMQVQRGLGASKVAIPSVGGTINIVTKTTDTKKGGSMAAYVGNDGYQKYGITLSTGKTAEGWAVTFSGSKTKGVGYIDRTQFEAYSYFLNISKEINEDHMLSFTVFGAPQWHNQRSSYDKQSIEDWRTFKNGYKYNASKGYDSNGQEFGSAKNSYHKPQASLNWYWTIDDTQKLSTSAYVSMGSGWGYSPLGDNRSDLYGGSSKRTITGDLDYAAIESENAANPNGSQAIIALSRNNHKWYGLLSSYNNQLSDKLNVSGGIDLRYYVGTHTKTIENLMGGQFYIDQERQKSNHLNPNERLHVGDVVARDYDGLVLWTGVFGQAEYEVNEDFNVFVSGAFSNNSYQRQGRFYTEDKSDTKSFLGYSLKGGGNYNLNENHNVFINGGYFSRAPYFANVFLSKDFSNSINGGATNEKIGSIELGYGFRESNFNANANIYYTQWLDKGMSGNVDNQDPTLGRYNIQGVDATHMGVEVDFTYRLNQMFNLRGMVSVGDWKWADKELVGLAFNEQGQPVDKDGNVVTDPADQYSQSVNLGGVHVGDAAQTTASLGLDIKVMKGLKFGITGSYFDRYYAKFRVNKIDGNDSWKAPSYFVTDLNLKYDFKISGVDAMLFSNVNNLFDTEYISDADDGSNHDWKTARVFYGFGRTWSMGLKVKF